MHALPPRTPPKVLKLQINADYSPQAAGSVLAILPAIVLFVALQRFIVGAFTAGALKC